MASIRKRLLEKALNRKSKIGAKAAKTTTNTRDSSFTEILPLKS